jgi:hypothetical protein
VSWKRHIVDVENCDTGKKGCEKLKKTRNLLKNKKASSTGILMVLLVLTTLVGGYFYYDRVGGSIENMTNKVNEQMTTLLLRTFSINASCITSYIANTGLWAIKIVSAYVNQHAGTLNHIVEISKDAVEAVCIVGQYVKGATYIIELVNNFGSSISFEIVYN